MSIHVADGIVLRHWAYRETSAMVSCLTDRFGKIRGMIKGLRGPRSTERYRSPMEPLTLNRIVFYDNRNSGLHLISQCDLTGPYLELTEDLETMQVAACCAELVDVLLEADEPQPAVFALLKSALERLVRRSDPPVMVRIHVILRLLRLVGFQPQLDHCVVCTDDVTGRRTYWSVRQGGLMCERCLHQDTSAEPMAPELLEALALCAEAEPPRGLHPGMAAVVHRRVEQFLRWRIERPLKTLPPARDERRPGRPSNRGPLDRGSQDRGTPRPFHPTGEEISA
jgi:DNA repair protein RecO (recombination protein O)